MNIISNINVSVNANLNPPSNEFSKISLPEKIERATQELGVAFSASEKTLEALTVLTDQEDALIEKMEALVQRQMKLLEDVTKDEKEKTQFESDLKTVSAEKNDATQSVGKMTDVLKKIKDHLACAICTELSPLPTVVGLCGHITCSDCLHAQDASSFSSLTDELATPAHVLSCMQKRSCSLCRGRILGVGLPLFPLKEVTERILLFENKERPLEKTRTYEISEERTQLGLLAMRAEADAIAAQCAVVDLLPKISKEQWGADVIIYCTRTPVFVQTVYFTLHSVGMTFGNAIEDYIYPRPTQQKEEYPEGGYRDWKSAVNKVEELEIFLNETRNHQIEMTQSKLEEKMKDELGKHAANLQAAVQKSRKVLDDGFPGGTQQKLGELNEVIRQTVNVKSAYGKLISQEHHTFVTMTEAFSRIEVFKTIRRK